MAAASVGGELHEVGLRDRRRSIRGGRLGHAVPRGQPARKGSVVQAVEQHRPDLLVISVTMAFHLRGSNN